MVNIISKHGSHTHSPSFLSMFRPSIKGVSIIIGESEFGQRRVILFKAMYSEFLKRAVYIVNYILKVRSNILFEPKSVLGSYDTNVT